MQKIDVSGLSCPLPVIKTKKVIDQGENEIIVVGTSQVSKENVCRLAASSGYSISIIVDEKDAWEIQITK